MAKTVTIARVASALSTDRAYQPLFLHGLQNYFENTTRLLKQGDVIAVGINTDNLLRHAFQSDSDTGEDAVKEIDLELVTCQFALYQPPLTDLWRSALENEDDINEIVYFAVTNIEHSVPSRLGEVASPDMYVSATVGELGCWVDPAITRVVQTGIEHSRVPDLAAYRGLRGLFCADLIFRMCAN